MRRHLIIVLLVVFMPFSRICAQSQVRVAVPNTTKMVKNALAKSRARKENRVRRNSVRSSAAAQLYAKMLESYKASVPSDTTDIVLSADTCSTRKETVTSLPAITNNESAFLDFLNMFAPGTFNEKDKALWNSLPKETRKAILSTILYHDPKAYTQDEIMTDPMKAAEYYNSY